MKQLIVLLVLCVSLVSAVKFLDGNPTCGTYGPQWWVNNGMTLQFTLQFGAPLSPQLDNQPFFFGCTPVSIYSHMYNHTIDLTYFNSSSPNDNLVDTASATDKADLGEFSMLYDDSEGNGTVAVIMEANMVPRGVVGRANISYGYNNYSIGAIHARSEWFTSSLDSLIGEGEVEEVEEVVLPPRRRTSIAATILDARTFSPDNTKTVMHSKMSFLYNTNSQVRKEIVHDNTTQWNDNKESGYNFTISNYDFKYKMDSNGMIIQLRTFQNGTAVGQADFTYDPSTGLLSKACNNGCATYSEHYYYDDSARLTELKFSDGSEWKFKYDGADSQVSTADFGADYGMFTFNY